MFGTGIEAGNRVSRTARKLRGVSALALASAGLAASPAMAQQATPGSAQCPIDADTVMCRGDVHDGFRSDQHPTLNRLIFKNLTQPIAPQTLSSAIDVRPIGDLTLDLDTSVRINASLPRSSFSYGGAGQNPDAAIALLFDAARQTTATVTNAGMVNAARFGDSRDFNMGAFLIADADIVNFTNAESGTIIATNDDTSSPRRLTSGVRIVGADQIAFRNDGSITSTGVQSTGVFLEGRSVQFVNTGQIGATNGTTSRAETWPVLSIAIGAPSAAANLEFRNTGAIRSTDTPYAAESLFGFYGRGTIDVFNGGALVSSGLDIRATAQNRTDDLVVTVSNSGPVSNTQIGVLTSEFLPSQLEGRTSLWPADTPPPAGARYRDIDISVTNSGRMTTATIGAGAEGDNVRISVVNRGILDGPAPGLGFGRSLLSDPISLIFAEGIAPMGGNAVVSLVNEGEATLTDADVVGHSVIEAYSSHQVNVINRGRINVSFATDTTDTYGLNVSQGEASSDDEPAFIFDGSVNVSNSGSLAFDLITGFQPASAILINAVSRVNLTNTAPIALTNREVDEPYVATGVRLYGLSNVTFDNSAAITVTTPTAANSGGIGIAFLERSLSQAASGTLDAAGRLGGYSRAADIASVFTLNLAGGDVTVNGSGSYGIFGIIGDVSDAQDGLLDPRARNRATSVANGSASAHINIASGVSVLGGSGPGAAIVLEGAGQLVLNNAGSVIGRGDAIGGAVVLGQISTLDTVVGRQATPTAFTLSLIDSINTGTIRADAGRGIWVRAGSIANLVNYGLISGGIAAIEARDVSQIDNQTGGVIDGAIMLGGAGSSLRNGGIVRMTSGSGTTSNINGDYIQLAGATLALRESDRFNATGNFVLAGDLNLALGAPTGAAIINVGGNLTLDGRLNVTDVGGFGDGVYRLINYNGMLSGNSLTVGTLPQGSGTIQTSVAQQVNLIVSATPVGPGAPPAFQFWDGTDIAADLTVDGGSGMWNNTTTNWTRRGGDVNEAWGSAFAVFQGAPGTVTIASEGVSASGMQFAIDGYRVEGGALTLTSPASLRVGDGSAGGAGYSATIDSSIGGAGGIEKTDLGTLILSGANGYTGGTRITGGVLQVGADGALGTGGLTLNGGTLRTSAGFASGRAVAVTTLGGTIDTGAGTLALSGALTGSGALTKTGAGTLALSGDAGGFTGTTSIAAGTLDLRTTLGGTLAVASAGTLAGGGSAGATRIADGGTLAPGGAGVGTLTLASLALSQGSRLAFGLGAAGVVGVATNDLLRVTGNLVLDGTLDVTALPGFGEGIYRLIDYGGALTDNGLVLGSVPGAAQVQTILPGQVNLVVGSALQYWDGPGTTANLSIEGGSGTWSNTTTNWTRVAGDVNESWGRGFAVFQSAPGTVTVAPDGVAATGVQFAVDGYRIEGGPLTLNAPAPLRVGDGSAAGAGYIATIASSIAGTGGVFKTDLGTLTLTGANSYTGGTSVNGGVLQVAGDGALGAAGGGVTLDGGTLRLGGALTSARGFTIGTDGGTLDTGANTATLSGTLGGAGAFTKIGSGTLTYSGTGTAFTGPTRIAAGTLALTGTLGGPLSIANGATLTGTGRAASLDLAGTVAPGNSPGTLSFTGDALFRAGSTYQVDLAGNGATDLIRVGGAAVIESGSVAINQLDPRSAYTDGAVYRILDAAGGRTGTFSGVTRNSLLFGFTLGYDPTGAFVTARAVTTTYNQGEAALGLEAFERTTGTDGAGVFNALLALDTASLRAALDASSGEIYAGLLTDALGSGTARADRLLARATTPAPEGWGMWGGLDGRTGTINGDGNAARLDHSGYGFELGIDYRGSGNTWALGAGGGYVHGSLESDARSSRARSSGWQIGGYARYGTGGAGITASVAASYQHQDADVTRRIAFAGVDRTADGRASLTGRAVTGELRYGVAVSDAWSLGPIASVHYARAKIDDIRETGPASLALTGRGSDDWTRYGGGAFLNWQSDHGAIDLSAQYVGGNDNTANVALAFAGSPATAFDIRAPRIRAAAALLNLGAQYDLGSGWSLAGTARAIIAREQRSVSANATLGWRF